MTHTISCDHSGNVSQLSWRIAVFTCEDSGETLFFRTDTFGRDEDARTPYLDLHTKYHGKPVNTDIPSDTFYYEVRLEEVSTPQPKVKTINTDTLYGAWTEAEYIAYRDHGTYKEPKYSKED